MKFTPRSEQEVTQFSLLKKGLGDFEITSAEEMVSKKGKEMLHLTLKVWDFEGASGTIHDYILNDEKFQYKLRHLCYSVGVGELYEAGEVKPGDLLHRAGKLDIGIQKDKTGEYPDKNNVKDYCMPDKATVSAATTGNDFEDDDVPF